jgi:hypothetical protein
MDTRTRLVKGLLSSRLILDSVATDRCPPRLHSDSCRQLFAVSQTSDYSGVPPLGPLMDIVHMVQRHLDELRAEYDSLNNAPIPDYDRLRDLLVQIDGFTRLLEQVTEKTIP